MQRIHSFDLARGFTVLFIPAIHSCMLYSDPSVHHTLIGKFLKFIAEGPGAQLFMLLMGINFSFRSNYTHRQIFTRSIALLVAGYILNILKFSIPYSLELLPPPLLADLSIHSNETALSQLSGIGDILHFAAISNLILHAVYTFKQYHTFALCLALIITFGSPYLWDLQTGDAIFDYFISFANGQPPNVFFPLLPWLIYPLVGIFIGHYLQRDQHKPILTCGLVGTILVIAGLTAEQLYPVKFAAGFYRTPPSATLWHMGIVLITLFAWQFIQQQYSNNLFFRLLTYSSRNITTLYFIQWILTCWLLPVVGYRELNTSWSAVLMIAITINTYLFTFTFQLLKQHYERSNL